MDSALERREGALAISLLRQQFIHKIQLAHGNVKFIFGRYYPWILSMAWQRFCFRRFNFPFSMERIRDDWYMTLAKSHSAQPNWNSTNVHRKRTFHSFQLDWWSMAMHLSKYHVIHTQTNTRKKKPPKAKIAFNRNKWMRCSLRVLFLLLLLLFHVYFDIIRLLIHFEFSAVLARTFISLSLSRIVWLVRVPFNHVYKYLCLPLIAKWYFHFSFYFLPPPPSLSWRRRALPDTNTLRSLWQAE